MFALAKDTKFWWIEYTNNWKRHVQKIVFLLSKKTEDVGTEPDVLQGNKSVSNNKTLNINTIDAIAFSWQVD